MTGNKDKTSGLPSTATRNVEEIARLEHEQTRELPLGERISLAITDVAGTFTCAAVHVLAVAAWLLVNNAGPEALRFDPYPHGLLASTVSVESVILAIFVLITQNRMSRQSDRRDHLNLQVDLLAEQEMTMVLRLLNRMADHIGLPPDTADRTEATHLMERTNIYQLMEEMRKRIK